MYQLHNPPHVPTTKHGPTHVAQLFLIASKCDISVPNSHGDYPTKVDRIISADVMVFVLNILIGEGSSEFNNGGTIR